MSDFGGDPNLLKQDDFHSNKLLFKIYNYLLLLISHIKPGINVDNYFTEENITQIMKQIEKCHGAEYNSHLGAFLRIELASIHNARTRRSYSVRPTSSRSMGMPSVSMSKHGSMKYTNMNPGSMALNPERRYSKMQFESFFHKIAKTLVSGKKLKNKEEQLEIMNGLFCNLGHRINQRLKEDIKKGVFSRTNDGVSREISELLGLGYTNNRRSAAARGGTRRRKRRN
jgi:hypothetical protein